MLVGTAGTAGTAGWRRLAKAAAGRRGSNWKGRFFGGWLGENCSWVGRKGLERIGCFPLKGWVRIELTLGMIVEG